MRRISATALAVSLVAVALPSEAQWLNQPTPNIPRTSSGAPNLAAPAPRGMDGHPDLSGPWMGRAALIRIPADALTPQSKALIQEREENYFKDRPSFQCQPSGPEPIAGWRRIIQTPTLIAIAYENLTYRLIFMDGRTLEADPDRRGWGTRSGGGKATRWSSTASASTIARGSTRAACRTRKPSGRPSATAGGVSDGCRSS